MKTLIPIAVIILSVYYYMETHKEQPPPVAAVAPTPRKAYYHSPLDAPAMGTGIHSGFGYNSKSRYTNWQGSHLSDGAAPRTASNGPAVPDADDSEPPR